MKQPTRECLRGALWSESNPTCCRWPLILPQAYPKRTWQWVSKFYCARFENSICCRQTLLLPEWLRLPPAKKAPVFGPFRNHKFLGAPEGMTITNMETTWRKHMVACGGLSFRFHDLSLFCWFRWLFPGGHLFRGLWFFLRDSDDRCLIAAIAGSNPGTNDNMPSSKPQSEAEIGPRTSNSRHLQTLNRMKTINPWMCSVCAKTYGTRNTMRLKKHSMFNA